MLHAGLDIAPMLTKSRSGVPYYVEMLTKGLLADAEKHQDFSYVLAAASTRATMEDVFHEREIALGSHARFLPYDSFLHVMPQNPGQGKMAHWVRHAPDRLYKKTRKMLQSPPRGAGHLQVFHHTDYLAHDWAGTRCRHVVTIHDLIPVHYPEKCSPSWLWFAEKAFAFAKTRAESIITYSRSSQQDIAEHLKFPEERIHVVPLATRPALLAVSSEAQTTNVLTQYGLQRGRYVMAVGRLDPLKNIARLVEAFGRCVGTEQDMSDVKLVLTGPLSSASREDGVMQVQEALKRYGVVDRCIMTGFVSDETLAALMGHCLTFVFPSLFEGFGLPVLEAMALGAPVICSNVSSVPEVAGDAAILIDPLDTDAIADAILTVARDPARGGNMREKGRLRAADFSWEAVAKAHQEVYRGVGAGVVSAERQETAALRR